MTHTKVVLLQILLIFVPILFSLVPGHGFARLTLTISSFLGGWPMAVYELYKAGLPWSLTLDYQSRRFVLTVGYRPFVRTYRGSFDQCRGVAVLKATSKIELARPSPCVVALRMDNGRAPKNFPVQMANDLNEATVWAQNLSERLGTTLVDSAGNTIAVVAPSPDVLTFTQGSTFFERLSAKRWIQTALLCLFLTLFMTAVILLHLAHHKPDPTFITVICIFWAAFVGACMAYLKNGSSWKLTLNHWRQTYKSEVHFGPFVVRSSGGFGDIKSVDFEPAVDMEKCDPYFITLTFKKNIGRKKFRIAAANTVESATARSKDLERWLGLLI
jgi:hypothetical protein